MTPAQYPNDGWHQFCPHSILALLNARLALVMDGADRPHYDALANDYAGATLFAPSREATRLITIPAQHPTPGDNHPPDA